MLKLMSKSYDYIKKLKSYNYNTIRLITQLHDYGIT